MKNGWQTKTLGELCEVVNGGTPKTGVPEYWNGNHLWITPAEMGNRISPYVDDTERKITDLGLRDSSARMLPPNSVILSSRAPIGHLVINTAPMATNQGCKGLVPGSQLQYRFLYYYLTSIVDLLNSLGTGATFKELSGGKLKEVTVPFPSLPEQRRIVGILDKAFDGVATAKANTEKNLQNSRTLFESHLQSVFTRRGPGWVEKRLGDVADTQYGLSEPMNEEGKGYKIFRMGEVQGGRLIDTGRMKFADISRAEFEKYKLQPADILFNRTNSFELVGKTGILGLQGDYCFASYLVRVLLKPDVMLPAFLNYFMNSERFQASVKKKASKSINQANINATILSNESIPFPESLKEQKIIITRLDALREETQHLGRLYQRKLAALEQLKRSLLHQAFAGELSAPSEPMLQEAVA